MDREERLASVKARSEYHRRIAMQEIKMLHEIAEMVEPEMAAKPTTGRPGSERKILRMSARYSHGLPLYVRGDAV